MKLTSFFKILNKKIEKYDKMTSNPFERPQSFIIVWVEDADESENSNNKDEL